MGMKATKEQLYAAIQREREYQKQKWPETGKPLDLYGYMIVAHEELREARLAFCKHVGNEETLRELLQVVAVGIAWHESRESGIAWQEYYLEEDYEDLFHSLPRWLEVMEYAFSDCRHYLCKKLLMRESNEERVLHDTGMVFFKIIAMGMRALMEHGVVEREEFSRQKDGD